MKKTPSLTQRVQAVEAENLKLRRALAQYAGERLAAIQARRNLPAERRAARRADRERFRRAVAAARHAAFVLNHPTATWFSRLWSARGRRINAKKADLEHRVGKARVQLALAERARRRAEGAADLRERFRLWDRDEDLRVRRETLKDFRLLEPTLKASEFDRRMSQRAVRVRDLPTVAREEADGDR